MFLDNKNIVLLETGSFNPPTNMHLRMFEVARDHLTRLGYTVCGGIVSPVHDSYKKKDLVSSNHRCAMIELALTSLPWVKMSNWEVKQNDWTVTRQVLQYHQNYLNSAINSSLNGNNKDSIILPQKFIADLGINKSKKNRNINLRLLCGADLLESFAVPGLWDENDANIIVVTEWMSNDISSTKIRRALCRNDSVKFLMNELVESYIKEHGLYGTNKNKYISLLETNICKFLSKPTDSNTIQISGINKKVDNESCKKQNCSKKIEITCKKSKVSNEDNSKLNFYRVGIHVSKNGFVEIISDKETMV
ncbi:nicotinamide/nicotinic acid mononucleotide adenylyltransferase 1 isoform X3 [Daktulosphaira vitifoliae]|uniref:nicotinamide/nicotinic acid mononucleotide adenylyltransferase 1 isoform X3 n=1 Tax=Daktulosphaira vitifoliae TaxID=58002 RepID=UPI0021AACA96|nr:nicotinamide/nicotinic acid mononucleotide adenylyltransferase 1 isoform X3 [Daktulosphaira vitifoliae]